MKKWISLVLALAMLLSLAACGGAEAPETTVAAPETVPAAVTTVPVEESVPEITRPPLDLSGVNATEGEKKELQRAYELGLPMEKLGQATVSGKEITELLDAFLLAEAPEALEAWQALYPELRQHEGALTRFDAMAAMYLALELAGEGYEEAPEIDINYVMTLDHDWKKDYGNWDIFGGFDGLKATHDKTDFGKPIYANAVINYYNIGRKSYMSGEYPFAYDEASNSYRVEDNVTYTEAVLALIRFKESIYSRSMVVRSVLKDSTFLTMDDSAALAPYYTEAQARKEAILDSPTTIVKANTLIRGETYTGTAYYVSENGDDSNDGLTPDTPWKTPQKTHNVVRAGDAVFFERGSTFRLTESWLELKTDVTYSAYGEGEKPVFTLSPENAARSECWELYHEGSDGAKIWKYYQPMAETGGIVLDDSSYAQRVWEWPTADGWLAVEQIQNDPITGNSDNRPIIWKSLNEYRTPEEALSQDLSFLSRSKIPGLSIPYPGYMLQPGELYLRCDSGNPGEMFNSIEFLSCRGDNKNPYLLVGNEADGFVLDNLSIKHFLDNAVCARLDSAKDAVIQNCTIEWGGNRLHDIEKENPEEMVAWGMIGDGLYNVCKNATVRNNYARQVANLCLMESMKESVHDFIYAEDMGTFTITGNVMENTAQGLYIGLWFEEEVSAFDKILIQDNYILDTGNSMNNGNGGERFALNLCHDMYQYADHIEVCDNVLLGCTMCMVHVPPTMHVQTDIHDNVIGQSKEGLLLTETFFENGKYRRYLMSDVLES